MAEKESTARQISIASSETPSSHTISEGTEPRHSGTDFSIHSIQHAGAGREDRLKPQLSRQISRRSYASGAEGYVDITDGLRRTKSGATLTTTQTSDPAFEVEWEEGEDGNPKEWPFWYKSLVIFAMSYGTSCVVLYSTSYTSSIPGLQSTFGISDTTGILGVTTYLLGMATGSVILAPLSEMYGRRPIYIIAVFMFVVLILPCALAPNIEAILVTRFFGAFAASALISNAPGTVNDIVVEKYRALAFSIWRYGRIHSSQNHIATNLLHSIGPMNGPVFGPVIGGFTFQYLGWRWTNWMVMILSGAAFILVASIQETYGPAILRKRAAARRKETGDERHWSRYDEKTEFLPLLKINLSRPFKMLVLEPIWYVTHSSSVIFEY